MTIKEIADDLKVGNGWKRENWNLLSPFSGEPYYQKGYIYSKGNIQVYFESNKDETLKLKIGEIYYKWDTEESHEEAKVLRQAVKDFTNDLLSEAKLD